MDIYKYMQRGKISSLVSLFSMCRDCQVVDTFLDRIRVGTPCPTCHSPSKGGLIYFNVPILGLVDLIQEAYGAIPLHAGESSFPENPEMTHSISVIVFFSTLREALLVRLIDELMICQNLSIELQDRLYKDYNSHNERLFKLFPALAGLTWDDALKTIQTQTGRDFSSVSDTLKEIADIRNRFIHKVNYFGITYHDASKCIENLYPTFELFVALHNLFIHAKINATNIPAA
jgi:hypothetical protein